MLASGTILTRACFPLSKNLAMIETNDHSQQGFSFPELLAGQLLQNGQRQFQLKHRAAAGDKQRCS